jgi:ankyrin repeat protein
MFSFLVKEKRLENDDAIKLIAADICLRYIGTCINIAVEHDSIPKDRKDNARKHAMSHLQRPLQAVFNNKNDQHKVPVIFTESYASLKNFISMMLAYNLQQDESDKRVVLNGDEKALDGLEREKSSAITIIQHVRKERAEQQESHAAKKIDTISHNAALVIMIKNQDEASIKNFYEHLTFLKNKGYHGLYISVDPDYVDDQTGKYMLDLAIETNLSEECLKLIFDAEKKVNLDFRDENGQTPLHLAVLFNNKIAPKWLYQQKFNFLTRNGEELTAFELALSKGNLEMTLALLRAVSDTDKLKIIIQLVDNRVRSLLHLLFSETNLKNENASYEFNQILSLLLENDIEVNKQDSEGNTPLHYLGRFPNNQNVLNCVSTLIAYGARAIIKNTDEKACWEMSEQDTTAFTKMLAAAQAQLTKELAKKEGVLTPQSEESEKQVNTNEYTASTSHRKQTIANRFSVRWGSSNSAQQEKKSSENSAKQKSTADTLSTFSLPSLRRKSDADLKDNPNLNNNNANNQQNPESDDRQVIPDKKNAKGIANFGLLRRKSVPENNNEAKLEIEDDKEFEEISLNSKKDLTLTNPQERKGLEKFLPKSFGRGNGSPQ